MITLDTIFRSIVNFKNVQGEMTLTHDELIKNFRSLQQIIPNPPEDPTYKVLYIFILNFIKKCDGGGGPQLPSYDYIKNYFQNKEGNESVLSMLDRIKQQQPCEGEEFRSIIKEYKEEQDLDDLERILTNTNKIARYGMETGFGRNKRQIKGISDSKSYFAQETRKLDKDRFGIKLQSQIVSEEDAKEVKERYRAIKSAPDEARGIITGIKAIDNMGTLKNKHLMLIAAFAKQGKTTFALNMAYRAIIEGWNTLFISLEMSFEELRNKVYLLHTCNPEFKRKYPNLKHLVGKLDKNRFEDGKLTDEEEELFNYATDDLGSGHNEEYGFFDLWQPKNTITTLGDIELKMMETQSVFKAKNRELEFVVLDYVTLLGVDRAERTSDHRHDINNSLKALKQICLTFNNGKGVRMLSPFQISRKAFEEAKKNEGKYDARAFSDYNEAERSADRGIALYVDEDMKSTGQVKIWDILERRYRYFPMTVASVNQSTDFIYDSSIDESDPIVVINDMYSVVP